MIEENLIWVDIETTGLTLGYNTTESAILEMAMVLTGPGLEHVNSRTWHCHPEKLSVARRTCEPFAFQMHHKSGLWADLKDNEGPYLDDFEITQWLADNGFVGAKPAGSSVQFDRDWIGKHLPQTRKMLHGHRVFDVSTLRAAFPEKMDGAPKSVGIKHRALDDIMADIELTRYLL